MSNFRELRQIILSDLFRYNAQKDYKSFIISYFRIPGYKYTFWLRLTNYYFNSNNKLLFNICRLRLRHFSFKYGIQIPYSTKIGSGYYIGHFSCIVVSSDAIIGKNVNISQGVTIGKTTRGSKVGAAVIGNEVYIGPGAKIIGNVHIGNNVAIGANAVVTKNISDNSVVVGIPAKVISSDGAYGYINNKI